MELQNFAYNIAPLLGFETALFRLPFRAGKALAPMDVAPVFRSRLGDLLRARLCLFPDYGNQPCKGCSLSPACGYALLFKQEPGKSGRAGGKPRQVSMPRPYTLALALPPGREVVGPGKEGWLVLTLIGKEAIR